MKKSVLFHPKRDARLSVVRHGRLGRALAPAARPAVPPPHPGSLEHRKFRRKEKKKEQKENTRPARSLLPAFTASRRLAGVLALCVERRPRRRERSQKSPAEGR